MANGDQDDKRSGRERRMDFRREVDEQMFTMAVAAKESSMQALAQINKHEEICTIRQGQILEKLSILFRILLIGTTGLVTALLTVAWTLLQHSLR